MPKIEVDWDERYPDFCIVLDGGYELDVTEEELAFIKRAEKDYEAAQKILARARPGP